MLPRPTSLLLILGTLCLACAGCTPALTAIPTGEWAGTGTYVEYQAIRKGERTTESRSKSATYATTLRITEGDLYGKHALFFDILSKRGEMINAPGTESHVTFALVKLDTLAEGPTLYALVNPQLNPSSEQQVSKEDFTEQTQVAAAVCFRQGCGIVVQVNYLMPTGKEPVCFWDAFTFQSCGVHKTGRMVQIKGEETEQQTLGSIDWVEELHKTK
jgi:hypothetical protein